MLARCAAYLHNACLTLTAIHPDGKHRTPSRHVPLDRPDLLNEALKRLLATNDLGWGAFVAVGLRKMGLRRYQRGGESDILALPAVFADLDDPSSTALAYLRNLRPTPSCITFTGGGFHIYWWLDQPLTDMKLARHVLRGLQRAAGSDSMSPVQSLRLVGSRNSKPQRNNTLCRIVDLHDRYYPTAAFRHLLPRPTRPPERRRSSRQTASRCSGDTLNPVLLRAVTDRLTHMGYVLQGDWLSGPCLYPTHHRHDDTHPSFGFNTKSGYGNCYVCGSILLKDICAEIGIRPVDYGGMFV